jgi:hypothetical protein
MVWHCVTALLFSVRSEVAAGQTGIFFLVLLELADTIHIWSLPLSHCNRTTVTL